MTSLPSHFVNPLSHSLFANRATCYNPLLSACVDSIKLCGVGLGQCNGICFNETLYYCNSGVITQVPTSTPPPSGLCGSISCGSFSCCEDIYTGYVNSSLSSLFLHVNYFLKTSMHFPTQLVHLCGWC
jgi:hypothetical protein